MVSSVISRLVILVFGTLYPAYSSYKAVKSKDVREYVKWMMYWVVFAFFTAFETVSDIFMSWVPFYYEIKIVFIFWLLSPATRGSSIIYRKFVHPRLMRHEKDIDKYIEHAKENGYTTLVRVGRQGINVATDTLVRTALTSQSSLVQTMRRYGSMQDLSMHQQRNDYMDGPMGRQDAIGLKPSNRASWHPMDSRSFDPSRDYDILQQQYRSPAVFDQGQDGDNYRFGSEQEHLYRQNSRRFSDDMNSIPEFQSTEDELSTSLNRASSEANLLEVDSDSAAAPGAPMEYESTTLPRASKRSTPSHRTTGQATKASRVSQSRENAASLARDKGGAGQSSRQRRTRASKSGTTAKQNNTQLQ